MYTHTGSAGVLKSWESVRHEVKWILDKPGPITTTDPWEPFLWGGIGIGNGTIVTDESGKKEYLGCTGGLVLNRASNGMPVMLTSPACVGIKTSLAYQPASMIDEGGKFGEVVFRKSNAHVSCSLVGMQ